MRRRRRGLGGNMDSLLDTLTNVVGILVIVLVITQLGVREAVQRISQSEQIDPAALARVQAEAARAVREREDLAARIQTLLEAASLDAAREKWLVVKQVRDLEANVAALQEHQARREEAALQPVRAAEKEIARQQADLDKLREEAARAEEASRHVLLELEKTPEPKPAPPKSVRLPNPRPAPEGTAPLVYLCREGRLIFVDAEAIQERARRRVGMFVQKRRLDPERNLERNRVLWVDCAVLVEDFNRDPVRTDEFDVRLAFTGHYPRLVLNRRRDAGETADDIRRSTSAFQQGLKRVDKRKHYARFFVWPDSFEVYLAARRMVAESGMAAGWEPMLTKEEHAVPLGGTLRCGPPPPPPPPRPKDEPPPKPVPPPPPPNVID